MKKKILDKISLTGMIFYGRHGDLPKEKTTAQKFTVDVDLFGDFSEAAQRDDLTKGVDYAAVFEETKQILEGKPCNLLEALAQKICSRVLRRFHRVKQVTARVRKPEVLLGGTLEAAAVEMTRTR